MHFKLRKYRKQIIYLIDTIILTSVYSFLALLLPKDGGIYDDTMIKMIPSLMLLITCSTIAHNIFKTYDILWRYAESKEYFYFVLGGVIGFIGFLLINFIIFRYIPPIFFFVPLYSMSLVLMLFIRFYYRQLQGRDLHKNNHGRIPIAIVGAGDAGVRLLDEIKNDPNSRYIAYCFIDDNIEKIGKFIHKVEIKGPIKEIGNLLQGTPVREVILSVPSIAVSNHNEILTLCSTIKYRVRKLPNSLMLMQNEDISLTKSIQDIKIEELLGRESVTFDDEQIKGLINGKVVMVTGGGGSIGSELCRHIAKQQPRTLVIIDFYENNAYDIQQELKFIYQKQLDIQVEIASVREEEKVDRLFEQYRPNIVFHAAAHKHVPLMEDCPEEAVKNNIYGTYNVVKSADRYGVEKFILISTDKAVNPTSIMGASKRFCEMILQSMKNVSKTDFASVRFGNVLGSNGSVVPLFQRQIDQGGPLTITDKRMVRYFMTISEAAQLVLQAGSIAGCSEVFVLDMGEPVKILDLAEKLIRLSGYEPYSQIPINEIGLRPGEKLYEEILTASDELNTTSNNKIFIEQQKEISTEEMNHKFNIIKEALETGSKSEIKKALKLTVPTYVDPEEVNIHISEVNTRNGEINNVTNNKENA